MADQDRAARAVGEMSGQPCGYEWTHGDVCGSGEGAPIHHGVGILGYPSHAYTPLERRTGKDRRGGQVAETLSAALGALGNMRAFIERGKTTLTAEDTANLKAMLALDVSLIEQALAAAPQAAPASASNEAGSLALRQALDAHDYAGKGWCLCNWYSTSDPVGEYLAWKDHREQAVREALAAADAAPERTLPSVEELAAAMWSVGFPLVPWAEADEGMKEQRRVFAAMVLAALRAKAKE